MMSPKSQSNLSHNFSKTDIDTASPLLIFARVLLLIPTFSTKSIFFIFLSINNFHNPLYDTAIVPYLSDSHRYFLVTLMRANLKMITRTLNYSNHSIFSNIFQQLCESYFRLCETIFLLHAFLYLYYFLNLFLKSAT